LVEINFLPWIASICNPPNLTTMSRRLRLGGLWFQASQGKKKKKKFLKPHLNGKNAGHGVCACHLSYAGMPSIGGSQSRLTWAESKT
jgi:hypothetical protein